MSFRYGGDAARREEEGDEELFEASSGIESDADGEDHFPDAGAVEAEATGLQDHRLFVPQPLRRMNSDSIYDMSSMTSQLIPAKKKGLSRYYEGRSQSFACMSEVRNLEDLQKKEKPTRQKIKSCKSYVALGGMASKASSNSCANLSLVGTNGFMAPPVQVNNSGYQYHQ